MKSKVKFEKVEENIDKVDSGKKLKIEQLEEEYAPVSIQVDSDPEIEKSLREDGAIVVYVYMRSSGHTIDTKSQWVDIAKFVKSRGIREDRIVKYVDEAKSGYKISWKDRKIGKIVQNIRKGDVVIVSELSRLGRKNMEVLNVVDAFREKGIKIYDIKNGWELDGTSQSQIILMALSMMAEIERGQMRSRVRAGQLKAKMEGKPIGRKKGSRMGSCFDKHEKEIYERLEKGHCMKYILKDLDIKTSPSNLHQWLKRRGYIKSNQNLQKPKDAIEENLDKNNPNNETS